MTQISRRTMLASLAATAAARVVLTFDDAVKSHLTVVAPILKRRGFRATFFITQKWMADTARFLTWEEAARLHGMGFEIGNHTWSHRGFGTAAAAAGLDVEMARVEQELARVGVPKPVSFAWPGNAFGPEALAVLESRGCRFARRGISPEQPYGKLVVGPAYNPERQDRLLIPTTGDAYPDWTFEHFLNVMSQSRADRIVVLQFHGVPDEAHPWVHTPPEMFERYMAHLAKGGFRTMALRDLEGTARTAPGDPMRSRRFPDG